MDDSMADSLAWVFFGTTTFVILSLVYEGLKWAYKSLFRKDRNVDAPKVEL